MSAKGAVRPPAPDRGAPGASPRRRPRPPRSAATGAATAPHTAAHEGPGHRSGSRPSAFPEQHRMISRCHRAVPLHGAAAAVTKNHDAYGPHPVRLARTVVAPRRSGTCRCGTRHGAGDARPPSGPHPMPEAAFGGVCFCLREGGRVLAAGGREDGRARGRGADTECGGWQHAAGAGDATAASFPHLSHLRRGEIRDTGPPRACPAFQRPSERHVETVGDLVNRAAPAPPAPLGSWRSSPPEPSVSCGSPGVSPRSARVRGPPAAEVPRGSGPRLPGRPPRGRASRRPPPSGELLHPAREPALRLDAGEDPGPQLLNSRAKEPRWFPTAASDWRHGTFTS